MTDKEDILNSLSPLFLEAKEKGLWFHTNYQDLWFSPSELKNAQSKGSFIWGITNWELRDPKEQFYSDEFIEKMINNYKQHNKDIEKRISLE
ncbi:MAG: hypothetical protein GY861_14080 [bacterium]|nr:hypothetical protein [bacterium]